LTNNIDSKINPNITLLDNISSENIMNNIFKIFIVSLFVLFLNSGASTQDAALLPNAKQTFLGQDGKPLSSGKVYFYVPATSTLKTTWIDADKTTANSNPVILDAAGRAIIYGDGEYRQVVRDRNNNLIWDQLTASAGSGGSSGATGDGDLVGTIKPWAGLTSPNQYVFAYGQEILRATYPELYTAITLSTAVFCTTASPILTGIADTTQIPVGGAVEASCLAAGSSTVLSKTASTVTLAANANVSTSLIAVFYPWGNGNGTTTFNVPDLRGKVIAGRTNMGGTSLANLTTTYYGTNPDATGATGGSQSKTLLTANLPAYTPSGSVNITDPGHSHLYGENNAIPAGSGGGNRLINGAEHNTSLSTTGITAAFVGTAQGGTSTAFSIVQPTITSNYIIKVTPDANSASATGVLSLGGMTGVIACGTGLLCTGNVISTTDVPVGANPSAEVGLTAVNGAAFTFMRSDGAPALSQAIAPTWTGFHQFNANVGIGVGAATSIPLDIVGRMHATRATFSDGPISPTQYRTADFIYTNPNVPLARFDLGKTASDPYTGYTGTGQAIFLNSYVHSVGNFLYGGIYANTTISTGTDGAAAGLIINATSANTWTTSGSNGGLVGAFISAVNNTGYGDNFAANFITDIAAGLPATNAVHGIEIDVNNASSTGVKLPIVINLGTGNSDAGACTGTFTLSNGGGTVASCIGIMMQAGLTSTRVEYGLGFIGQSGGAWPITATGTGIILAGGTADIGIDLSRNTTWTTAAFKSPGFTINGSGSVTGINFIPSSSTVPTNGLYLPAANTLGWAINSAAEMRLTSTALSPAVSGGNSLGTTSLMWAGLAMSSGSTINFDNSNYIVTHSAGRLTFSGAITTTGSFTLNGGIVQTANASSVDIWQIIDSGAGGRTWNFGPRAGTGDADRFGVYGNSKLLMSWNASTNLGSALGSLVVHNGTAIPAGGTAGAGYLLSSTSNFGIFFGSGAPSLSAAQGSLYMRSDGTANNRLYINTNGSTGWTAFNTAS